MADYGTVGNTLAKTPAPDATPTPAPTSDADTAPVDGTGLRGAVDANRSGTRALLGRLQDIDRRSDALVPPQMQELPKPPQEKDTPISERWGSIAMMVAGFSGLLTRTPLTTSLNAMAAVNHAYNEGDAAAAKTAFDTWKVANENAIKMNQFQVQAYDAAIKKYSTDRQGALAEIRANAAALKDDVIIQLLDAGKTDQALAILGARPTATAQLQEHADKLRDQQAAIEYFDQSHPGLDAVKKALGHAAIRAGKDPDDNSKDFSGTPPTQLEIVEGDGKKRTILADRDKKTGGWVSADQNRTPIEVDAHGGYRIMPKTQSTTNIELADVKDDVRKLHPDWSEGQLDQEANKLITASKQPIMSDAAAELNARVALKTGHVPTSMGRSQANIAKFQDTFARIANDLGLTADDIAANQVRFAGEMAESRSLGTASSRIELGAQELSVALPQALELSEKVWRPGFKKAAEIEQAVLGQSSDPDLLEFSQQNQAVMNAYALAMQRGGATTVSAMERAEKLLSTATSQTAYIRQLDRLNKEVQTIKYGTKAAKQDLVNEITGKDTELPPPKLSGVPRPGEPAVPVISDKAAYDALPSGGHYRKAGDPPDGYRTKP